MEKMYEVAGTSTLNGVNTFRFANGKPGARAAVLTRNGHTDVVLFTLPTPMTKDAATAYMKAQGTEAVMPTGHRKTDNPRKAKVEQAVVEGVQQDAHVTTYNDAVAAEAAKKAAFVEKMRLAREAKKARLAAEAEAA